MVVFTFSILFKCRRLHSVVVELQMFRAACYDFFSFFFFNYTFQSTGSTWLLDQEEVLRRNRHGDYTAVPVCRNNRALLRAVENKPT